MKKLLYLSATALICIAACSDDDSPIVTPPTNPPPKGKSLKKQWETSAVFKVPESVLYHETLDVLFVSNINGDPGGADGNGFISKLSTSGSVQTLEWVSGLDAPKGMGTFNDKLYVADINRVWVIDINAGATIDTINVAGAIFLNDVAIDDFGTVYISDTGANKIFRIRNGEANIWLGDTALDGPNGLYLTGTSLRFVEFNSGKLYEVDTTNLTLQTIVAGFSEGDGIVQTDEQGWLISGFSGKISFFDGSKITTLLNTTSNAADLGYVSDSKLVLVPTFFGNTVACYALEN